MAGRRKQPDKNREEIRPRDRSEQPAPDRRQLTERQAVYLADVTGVTAEKLRGTQIGQLDELLRFKIDPFSLLFRRVCGRVVRLDAGTGVLQGVPNATVHVEDTDCSFLGFFPVEGPWTWWWWFWPIFCHREEIGTAVTDECGRFCVSIPRWDIDRILRFRLERVCFPEIYKPRLSDFLKEIGRGLVEEPRFPVDPNPPDPAPDVLLRREVLEQAGAFLGRPLDRLAAFTETRSFGQRTDEVRELLEQPALLEALHPPLSDDSLKRLEQLDVQELALEKKERDRSKLALAELAPARAVGPFLRCRDVVVAEWEYILDVPDITFRVTQDVDGDGDEEEIYSEGFFDVRWNAGSIPPVTLQASSIARPSPFCEGPVIPCGNKPAIVTVGLMPLAATHHDNATGHAIRVNRPRNAPGLLSDPQYSPGQAPYAGTLQLHGCHHLSGAEYYRLLYSHEGGPETPFLGLEWYPPKLTGPPWWFHAIPDGSGWYEVLPENQLVFPHWLLNWPTWNGSFPNGSYVVRLELADGSKTPLAAPSDFSDPIRFTIDNRQPSANFSQIRWRVAGGSWLPQNTYTWPFVCIVIERPAGADIEIEVSWWASAVHFRDAELSASGCGAGDPSLSSSTGSREHWHVNFGDNSLTRTALYSLGGGLPQGSYSFGISAYSRAFNPAGDGGGPGTNWLTNYAYLWVNPSIAVSVVDA